jgi:glycosyltransferase involved in cell wall biosynthesis
MIPSIVVGPSTYAIEHEKYVLASNIAIGDAGLSSEYANYDNRLSIKSVVIPPSVDFDRFNPDMIGENDIIRHPKCHQQSAKTCINVGFVARLAVEKNPGLFLLAAHKILSQDPTVCFTVIGDGDLLPYLRNLAVRLNISGYLNRYNYKSSNMSICINVSVKIIEVRKLAHLLIYV